MPTGLARLKGMTMPTGMFDAAPPSRGGAVAAVAQRGADLGGKGARLIVRQAKKPLRSRWRRRVLRDGIDDTEASARRRTLVVAPHPDDETIGCGAAIARKRAAGTRVDVVVVCDGRHSHASNVISPQQLADKRAAESLEACALLGVDRAHVRFLGFEELTLWRCLDDIAAELAAVIDEVDPEEILVVTEEDWHTDHQATHVALLRALARRPFSGPIGAYPVWFWADGPWRSVPVLALHRTWRDLLLSPLAARRLPAARLVRTEQYDERKREAFACYTSQTTNLTGEAGWATFAPGWIEPFLGPAEVFFPVGPAAVARARHDRRAQRVGEGGPVEVGGAARATAAARSGGTTPAAPFGTAPPSGRRLAGSTAELTVELDESAVAPIPSGMAWPDEGRRRTKQAAEPAGRVRAVFETGPKFAPDGFFGVLFRLVDGAGWRVCVRPDTIEIARRDRAGSWLAVASASVGTHAMDRIVLDVVDDGKELAVRRNGELLFGRAISAVQHAHGCGIGVLVQDPWAVNVVDFDAWGRLPR